jgi:hypothetical protein
MFLSFYLRVGSMKFTKQRGGAPVAANDNSEFRFYVYAWLHPDGRPFYVGKGSGRRDTQPKSGNRIFNGTVAKIRKEGGEPTVVRWHEGLREVDAHRLEVAYIKLFGRRNNSTGVLANLTDGGEGSSGAVVGSETRAKMSSAQLGRTHSPETRAKIGEANSRRTQTPETRAKISEARRG